MHMSRALSLPCEIAEGDSGRLQILTIITHAVALAQTQHDKPFFSLSTHSSQMPCTCSDMEVCPHSSAWLHMGEICSGRKEAVEANGSVLVAA